MFGALYPPYAPEVPAADRRMGLWCERAAEVTLLLIGFALGTML